jgi:DNA/RNA-binding domain of Phe-tRNA-synthetase-like protein
LQQKKKTVIMKKVIVSDEIRKVCPEFVGAAVEASVVNTEMDEGLWQEIHALDAELQATHTTDDIKRISAIAATRKVYKALGKDPSRYRPSGEQLMRRILQGKGLYQINTLVDLVNLASLRYGYSIGGFDECKICGSEVVLGVGRKDEPYEGIGRGILNIEGMPVYRDDIGGFGTPTSDNERTKLSLNTTRLLCFVNGYDGNKADVEATANMIVKLVEKYCQSTDAKYELI